jgi:hypothetical protein
VLDQEWFVETLTKKDLATVCSKFKVSVQGFQKNLNNAPEHLLLMSIKEALNNGIKKKKKNALVFEEILEKIVSEVEGKCPYINNLTFEEFMIRAEMDTNLSTYQIIAVTFIKFPNEYKNHKLIMIDNLKNAQYIFHGLSKELTRPVIEKIEYLIDSRISEDENFHLLKRFQQDVMATDKGNKYKIDKPKTEEEAFKLLTEVHEKERYLVLVSFLLHNNHYKDVKYKSLLYFALSEIQKYHLQTYKEESKKQVERSLGYEEENNHLNDEIKRINSEYDKIKILLTNTEEQLMDNKQALEITQTKHDKLEKIFKQNEPLQMFFLRLVSENQFLIITKDSEQFIHTPFEGVTISPSDFKKQLRIKPLDTFREQVLFITRVSFQTGKEWIQFKNLLEESQLTYEELGHYEISYYIREIVEYLNRKEILVYADEI